MTFFAETDELITAKIAMLRKLKMLHHIGQHLETTHLETTSNKLYNKVVSQFVAGDVQESFGGYLAD